MNWKLNGDGPVYLQIMARIRSAVISGAYAPGQRIPPVRELAMEAKVNPNTMQRALYELEREGILISLGTIGREVTEDQSTIERAREAEVHKLVTQCLAQFRDLGLNTKDVVALLQRTEEREELL